MSNDFRDFTGSIEAEAEANGPEAVARLNEHRTRYRLASQLLGLRRNAGWSQGRLAIESGIQQSEISRIERGAIAPNEITWARLAAPFGYELALIPAPKSDPVSA